MQHEFRVEEKNAGLRIDRFLAELFPDKSRSFWQKLISQNSVLINGSPVKSSYTVETNNLVRVEYSEVSLEAEAETEKKAPPLYIIFEDKDIAVIEKEAGIVTHSAPGHSSGTLAEAVQNYFGDNLSDLGDSKRRGIVHRLDKDTSGLLLIAKNNNAHKELAKAFKKHEVLREYQSIVMGTPETNTGLIDAPLGRDPQQRKRMSVQSEGKYARTYFEVLGSNNGLSHLLLRLETGRTHQIRVHLAMINCPILNDEKYGGNRVRVLDEDDLLLHASKLAFTHPVSGEELSFSSYLPRRFDFFLEEIYGK